MDVQQSIRGKETNCKQIYFTTKTGGNVEIEKFKARLVAQGFNQVQKVYFFENYAPVTRINTVLLMLALSANLGWHIHQVDFESAFLNSKFNEEIYLAPPKNCSLNIPKGKFLKLNKSIYGLKQDASDWFKTS